MQTLHTNYICKPTHALQAPQLGNSAHQSSPETQCIAGIADLPGSFADQADPVNPFTLFGNTRYVVILCRETCRNLHYDIVQYDVVAEYVEEISVATFVL